MKYLLLLTFTCLSLLVSSCIFKYAKAVMQEARFTASKSKESIYKSEFTGYVILKRYCKECRDKKTNPHTYSVNIKLSAYPKQDKLWGSYYLHRDLQDSTILNFVITKEIFDIIIINDTIIKESDHRDLLIKRRYFHWLSENENFLYSEKKKK